MRIHSIPPPPHQIHEMGLSDLHEEEIKIFSMEYNNIDTTPANKLEYYVNTLQPHN
jgi:hypothetical protein